MTRNLKTKVALCGLAIVPVVAWSALAPPPLAAGPTPINALPFTINSPGTYCLTGNLTAGTGVDGIDVQASDVVIDLGGFRLSGGGDSPGSGIQSSRQNVTVRNGTITGWGRFGIELATATTVSNVSVRTEGSGAIQVFSRSLVERSSTESTTGFGISVSQSSRVESCNVVVSAKGAGVANAVIAQTNSTILDTKVIGGSIGIATGFRCRVVGCSATDFLSAGISVQNNCIVEDCTLLASSDGASLVDTYGISASGSSTIEGCSISGDIDIGIRSGERSQVLRCVVTDTRRSGITADLGTRVVDCLVDYANQSGSDGEAGIVASQRSRIEGCTVLNSQGPGILLEQQFGRVERCDVEGSTGDGIVAGSDVIVLANHAFQNDGAGIRVLGDRCVVMENVVDRNYDQGILIEGTLSHIERNLSSLNEGVDYEIPYGNPFGKKLRSVAQMNDKDPHTNFETPLGF